MNDVEIAVEADVPDAGTDFVHSAAPALWSMSRLLFEDRGLSVPAVTLIVTDDVMGVADRESERLGSGPDRRSGVERLGGVVAGKTMCNDAGDDAVVLIAGDLARRGDGAAQYTCAGVIAHEYGHLLYGAARIASIGHTEEASLPWDIAAMIGVLAAGEYRVNRISQFLVERVLPATNDDGNVVTLASVVGWWYLDGLIGSLDAVVPGMADTVNDYRNHRVALETMWGQIVRASEELTVFCAHADAHYAGDGRMLQALPVHAAGEILALVWSPLAGHLNDSPTLPRADEWAADRRRITDVSRDGWMAAWERLGLHPVPRGESFYLAVEAPEVS